MAEQGIGARVLRNEDDRFLNGRGQYLGDLAMLECQEVYFLRSPVAHAHILEIEVPEALKDCVFTSAHFDDVKPIRAVGAAPGFKGSDYPPLAIGKVRFVGEPVAICMAPTRADAEDMAQQIFVDYDELPAVVDMDAALAAGAAKVHDHWTDNLVLEVMIDAGDVDASRENAGIEVTGEYRLNRHAGVPMEGRGVLAYRDHRLNELVVYSSTQFPHVIRTALAKCLDIEERCLRVVAPDVGGGFGVKNNLQPEEIAIAALAMKLDHPVRWMEDRREHLLGCAHTREHRYRLTAFADAKGKILGLDADIRVDAGAYSVWPWTSAMEAGMAAGILVGPYDIRNYRARAMTIATTKTPMGPYRGVARTGACFGIERLLDDIAEKIGRDPVDVRLENMVQPGQMPYKTVTNKLFDSGDYPEALRRAAMAIGLDDIRKRQDAGEADGNLIGVGFGCYTEQTAHGTDEWVARGLPVVFGFEPTVARLLPDGGLVLEVGIQNHGQGLETTLAQVAHEELGVDPAKVVVRHGDSSLSPYGMGTFASRSMVMAGGAVGRACGILREKIARIAAHLLQAEASEIHMRDGYAVAGERSISLAEIGEAASLHPERLPPGEDPGLEVSTVYQPALSSGAFSYATHAALVALDAELGTIKLLDYVVVHDCGTVVNPMVVDGQIVGGVAQGIGTALYEEIPYDENGQPLATTFMDYLIPGAAEVPDIRVLHMSSPSPHTAYGIKGLGEGGAIAPPAAILNAANDALRPLGARVNETPLSPERVRAAIAAAREAAE
ncbi:MAG: xanthine dehydrogenase family protein [Rhodospirillaceae bacterium]|jgi:carbon-monoxide dehydrogenase large subunit|nr:xanthine dehydrogenase family protein [Rhodospirillaceae bacterium]MBT3887126.1 xanthine dehydrogenase family protein [Rhodospirillaceae bacterium]MBT4116219.1 xanthine dehydrogenase family protein [Rhodospirillaceae bacterium]MBT4673122.1 xanthine dehydrogenase family protein [Rhodospirillaceae bacterium]MBT4749475.1 xanthine dehydrogenase family protein [Rhodospirillaceae bacterium]